MSTEQVSPTLLLAFGMSANNLHILVSLMIRDNVQLMSSAYNIEYTYAHAYACVSAIIVDLAVDRERTCLEDSPKSFVTTAPC